MKPYPNQWKLSYICGMCPAKFPDMLSLKEHMDRTRHGTPLFRFSDLLEM